MSEIINSANFVILILAVVGGVYKFGKLEQKVDNLCGRVDKLNGFLSGGEE